MLDSQLCASLRNTKNLLAFSGGVDSSALFFLLCDYNVPFDIALVNYHTRAQSDREEAHALSLAHQFHKACFIHHAPPIGSNFEHKARLIRFGFFESLIDMYSYQNLLLGHQLNDCLEWLLLSLTKASGLDSMLIFHKQSRTTSKHYSYNLIRPLLNTPRYKIYNYLHNNNLPYFEDISNQSRKHARNVLRPLITPLIDNHAHQISQSFDFLRMEAKQLFEVNLWNYNKLFIIKTNSQLKAIHGISKALKKLGYVLSYAQRHEITKQGFNCVVGHQFAIGFSKGYFFVSPFVRTCIPKKFKEQFRIASIPPLIRPYLYCHYDIFQKFQDDVLTFKS